MSSEFKSNFDLDRVFDLNRLLEKLSDRIPLRRQAEKRAAVALLLRGHGQGLEVLLMRRSLSNMDPWSGQVCLPGGKEEAGDKDLLGTACRETMEELGVDLTARSRYVGSLDDVQVVAHGRVLATVITPHVFVQTKEVTIVPRSLVFFYYKTQSPSCLGLEGPVLGALPRESREYGVFHTMFLGAEASASFWLPLASALAGALDSTTKYRRREGGNVYLPSWRLGEEQIWGLTYNILRALLCLGTANKVGRLG